jgi:hypothetical protein
MPVRECSQWPTLDPELTKLRALACRTLTANMRTLRHAAWLATLLLMDRGQTLQAKRELVAARTLGSMVARSGQQDVPALWRAQSPLAIKARRSTKNAPHRT